MYFDKKQIPYFVRDEKFGALSATYEFALRDGVTMVVEGRVGSPFGNIEVRGARENNLKNISLDIPRRQITVLTGISGSGKTSLVFDTIAANRSLGAFALAVILTPPTVRL